jgi:hypothetical protein
VVDVADEGVSLEFSSAVTGGEQEDQISLLASTDFDGSFEDLESVKSATWVEITDRFELGESNTFTSSTLQDVSDLLVPEGPLFFAFKYITRPQAIHGLAKNWMIQGFTLKSQQLFNGDPITITDQANAGFRIVDQEPVNAPSLSTITTSRVSLLGNIYKDPNDPIYDPENPIYDPENPIYDPESHLYDPNTSLPTFVPYDPDSPYNDPQTETWAISKPLYINEVDLGPDWSEPLKGIANAKLEEFKYTYEEAGTYMAVFVSKNATIEDSKEVITEIEIIIVP